MLFSVCLLKSWERGGAHLTREVLPCIADPSRGQELRTDQVKDGRAAKECVPSGELRKMDVRDGPTCMMFHRTCAAPRTPGTHLLSPSRRNFKKRSLTDDTCIT